MKGVLFLAKAGAGYDADSGSVEQTESVELVWGSAFFLGGLDGLFGEVDGWEEVH